MAFRGSLSTGGSYGRAHTIVVWALENWRDFDTWCCLKGLEPFELPCYRYHNLALYCIKEGMSEEQHADLELVLQNCDTMKHPLQDLVNIMGVSITTLEVKTPEPEHRHKYIPSWWKGEEAAYNTARAAMHGVNTLPKMK